MKRFFDVQCKTCCILILLIIPKSEETSNHEENNEEDLLAVESRYRPRDYQGNYGEREYRKKSTDLPVTFQAPDYESKDYWNYGAEERDTERRLFLEEGYFPYENRVPYQGFYQLMSDLFGRDDFPKPKPFPFHRHHPSKALEPYPFEFPYNYRPSEANVIPPPKPVRASVVKLETVTKEPELHPQLDYTTTAKYYPHFVNLLNQVLIENARKQVNELGFNHGYQDPFIDFRRKPHFERPVMPRPITEQIVPTTYKPVSKFNKNANEANKQRYPGSIQDQLPPLRKGEDNRIPYVSATTFKQSTTTEKVPETTTDIDPRDDNIIFPTAEISTEKFSEIDIRLLNEKFQASTNVVDSTVKPTTPMKRNTKKKQTDGALMSDSTEAYAVTAKSPKKTSRAKKIPTPRVNDSVDVITDLTVKGLSKNEKANVNIPRYVNHFNMSNLISYEIDKLLQNQPVEPRTEFTTNDEMTETTAISRHFVDINDELSLDAKILRDTNWDGFTETETTTTENPVTTVKEVTSSPNNRTVVVETRVTKSISKIVGKGRSKDVTNEIARKETYPSTELKVTETKMPLNHRRRYYNERPGIKIHVEKNGGIETTTEVTTENNEIERVTIAPRAFSVPEDDVEFSTTQLDIKKTTVELVTLPTTTTNKEAELVERADLKKATTDNPNRLSTTLNDQAELIKRMDRPNFDESFDIASFITQSTTPFYTRRKYVRRPKVTDFTPYPDATEKPDKEKKDGVRFGTLNRSNFPKRQRPNITLSLDNRREFKINENRIKDEIMKFSDEDLQKKEQLKRRRPYFNQRRRYPDNLVRRTTSEQSVIN